MRRSLLVPVALAGLLLSGCGAAGVTGAITHATRPPAAAPSSGSATVASTSARVGASASSAAVKAVNVELNEMTALLAQIH